MHYVPSCNKCLIFRDRKSDPVQFKRGFLTGNFLVAIWKFYKRFSLLGHRTFMPQRWTVLALKRPFSKPYLNWTGLVFRLLRFAAHVQLTLEQRDP